MFGIARPEISHDVTVNKAAFLRLSSEEEGHDHACLMMIAFASGSWGDLSLQHKSTPIPVTPIPVPMLLLHQSLSSTGFRGHLILLHRL